MSGNLCRIKEEEAEREQAAAKIYKNIFKRYKNIFISIDVKEEAAERDQAAAKIQAGFRGNKVICEFE